MNSFDVWTEMFNSWCATHPKATPEEKAHLMRSCMGKNAYPSPQAAKRVMKNHPVKPGHKLTSYCCPLCVMFHIGNLREVQ